MELVKQLQLKSDLPKTATGYCSVLTCLRADSNLAVRQSSLQILLTGLDFRPVFSQQSSPAQGDFNSVLVFYTQRLYGFSYITSLSYGITSAIIKGGQSYFGLAALHIMELFPAEKK